MTDVDRSGLFGVRVVVGVVLGVVALVAAVVFAVGPAVAERSTYSWSVDPLSGPPAFSPLELTVPSPEHLKVGVPCPGSVSDRMVFETDNVESGLVVAVVDELLVVSSAGGVIVSRGWPVGGVACPGVFEISGSEWVLWDAAGGVIGSGTTDPVTVSRLAVDGSGGLAAGANAEVVTKPHGSRPSGRQVVAFVVALVAGVVSLVLVVGAERRGSLPRLSLLVRQVGWVDGVVLVVILVWAVLGPSFYDDGWLLANQRAYAELGTITNDFETTSSNLPLGYWYNWLWHFWTTRFDAPLYLRGLVVVLISTAWVAVRAGVVVALPELRHSRSTQLLAALVFLVGTLAWLMTLRTEPLIALLATVSLAAMLAFRRRPSLLGLSIAVGAAGIALSAHPTGILAAVPLLVTIPTIVRWLGRDRYQWLAAAAVVMSLAAVTIGLAFADSDVTLKLEAAAAFRTARHNLGVLDEPRRYQALWSYGATPARLLSVGFAFVAVFSILVQGRRWGRLDGLPALSVAVGLGLLALMPSKWIWHFGGLVGIVAVAIAVESAQWQESRSRADYARLVPIGIVIGAVGVVALAGTAPWAVFDLMTLDWGASVSGRPEVQPIHIILFLGVAVAIALGSVVWLRRRCRQPRMALSVSMAIMIGVSSGIVITAAIGVLGADAVITDSWTFGRQNTRALVTNSDCGIAEEMVIPSPGGVGGVATLAEIVRGSHGLNAIVHSDVSLYLPCVRQRSIAHGVAEVPDILVAGPNDTALWPIATPQEYREYWRRGLLVLLGESYFTGESPDYGATMTRN